MKRFAKLFSVLLVLASMTYGVAYFVFAVFGFSTAASVIMAIALLFILPVMFFMAGLACMCYALEQGRTVYVTDGRDDVIIRLHFGPFVMRFLVARAEDEEFSKISE